MNATRARATSPAAAAAARGSSDHTSIVVDLRHPTSESHFRQSKCDVRSGGWGRRRTRRGSQHRACCNQPEARALRRSRSCCRSSTQLRTLRPRGGIRQSGTQLCSFLC